MMPISVKNTKEMDVFSYHTIYSFVSFIPIKFYKVYFIGEYSIDEIDHKKEFPLKMKLIF
jgi:hypothetical protein